MADRIDADYLVIGAGAAGMGFVDALVAHSDATVAIVDRRHAPGGHWLDAYSFVRLHQASLFYGVASTRLGDGRAQEHGPERGLQERATAAEIRAYYAAVLDRLIATGRVRFLPGCEHLGEGRVVSRLSGRRYDADPRCRLVDARYLAPDVPATTAPPFAIADGAHAIPVGDLVRVADAPSRFVVVGAGKTAMDACVWLLGGGVDPDAITWIRPRDAWMLDRAVVQPDPAVFIGMAADVMEAAARSTTADEALLRLEAAGVVTRVDRTVVPTMARTPTLASWELERLRTIEHVVRLGRVRAVERGRILLERGEARVPDDALVVHCAASGLPQPPLRPIWSPRGITVQPVRAGFPCFGAAAIGFVEATRDGDEEKNRVCRPSPFPNTPADWARMQALGARAAAALAAEPDLRAWMDGTVLNPARIPPDRARDPAVLAAVARLRAHLDAGTARLASFAGLG